MNFSTNEVFIEGILQEVDLTTGTDKNNKPYIRGTVTVSVDQSYGGKDEHEEIKISVYSGKYKNNGEENPAYRSIEGLNGFKRISTDGDNADGIRIKKASLSENIYRPKGADNVVTSTQISNSFFTKIPASAVKPKAVFKNDIFIREISDELNRDGEPTGRLKIVGILVNGYSTNYRADVITYFVENKQAIDYISKNWNEGETVNIGGYIRRCMMVSHTAKAKASGFGEAIDTGVESVRSEYIITTNDELNIEPFEEDDIRTLMGERMNRVNSASEEGTRKAASASAPAKARRGW